MYLQLNFYERSCWYQHPKSDWTGINSELAASLYEICFLDENRTQSLPVYIQIFVILDHSLELLPSFVQQWKVTKYIYSIQFYFTQVFPLHATSYS